MNTSINSNKVLLITEGPFPYAIGTWRQIVKEAQTLSKNGFDVSVLANKTLSQHLTKPVSKYDGIRVYYLDFKSVKGIQVGNISDFLNIVKTVCPDVICAYNSGMSLYSAIAAKAKNLPFIISLHDVNSLISLQSRLNFLLKFVGSTSFFATEFPAMRLSNNVVTTTAEFKELVCNYFRISKANVEVVTNSPSISETSDIPEIVDKRLTGKFTVVYTGMIDHFRCLNTVVESLKYVSAKDFLFVIIGDALDHDKPYLEQIKRTITLHNLSNKVLFVGCLPHKVALAYTKSCDVSIIPHKRNFYTEHVTPTKLHEYAALSKPIITTPLRPVLNLYKDSVIIWNGEDPKALANIFSRLYSERKLRNDLGQQVRKKFVEDYCWDVQSKKYVRVFKQNILSYLRK